MPEPPESEPWGGKMGGSEVLVTAGSRLGLLLSGLVLLVGAIATAGNTAFAQEPSLSCAPAVGRVVAIQGNVQVQRAGSTAWVPCQADRYPDLRRRSPSHRSAQSQSSVRSAGILRARGPEHHDHYQSDDRRDRSAILRGRAGGGIAEHPVLRCRLFHHTISEEIQGDDAAYERGRRGHGVHGGDESATRRS